MKTDRFKEDEWDEIEWSEESKSTDGDEKNGSSVSTKSSEGNEKNSVKEELQSEKTKETIERTRSVSPFLSWVFGYLMYLTKELWFIIPAFIVGLLVAGLFTGFGTITESLSGVVWGGKKVVDAGVKNPEYVFGGFLFVYGYFLWRIEMWSKQNISEGVIRETLKMAIIVTPLAGFISYSLFIGGFSGEQAETLYTISIVAYTVIGWIGGSKLWKLTYYDESTLRLMPPKFITVWLARVGASTGGYIFLFGIPTNVPVIGFSLLILVTPLTMWGYLGWRFIRIQQKNNSSEDSSSDIDFEPEETEGKEKEPLESEGMEEEKGSTVQLVDDDDSEWKYE